MTLNVAVTGGRWYDDQAEVSRILDEVLAKYGPFVLFHGNATGADTLAKFWAIDRGIEHKPFKANWASFGKAAGPIRNREMVKHADMLIAFPGGKGTNDCIKTATMAGVPVFVAIPIEGNDDGL
jgi:predicted polyphosphate/ATP-dependent NAD kinase